MKLCTVLKNILTKISKIIQRNKKKGHFGPNFGPITEPKAIFFFFLKKKSFKLILVAMKMLFRGKLRKMSQQIGVNLDKIANLG